MKQHPLKLKDLALAVSAGLTLLSGCTVPEQCETFVTDLLRNAAAAFLF